MLVPFSTWTRTPSWFGETDGCGCSVGLVVRDVEGDGVSGVVIHAVLCREHGFTGSYSSVHRLLASIHATQPPEATVRLDFAPGEAAQVDFGAGPMLADERGIVRRTWCFVMTLAFSRHQYVEFVFDQTVATWLGCHRRAFEWFCAIPERVIIDNPKCAITRACARDPVVQRAYAECAEGYGFKIDPCPPADPQKKGIVESGVKYVKGNFLPLRSFRDLTDLNAQARAWVMQEAGPRIHGTTRHVGKVARVDSGARARLQLRSRLREAIAREDYELAVTLRDQLRQKGQDA